MSLSLCMAAFAQSVDLGKTLGFKVFDPAKTLVDSEHPLLILHSRPELALARGLASGLSAGAALAQWEQEMQSLLALTRQKRWFCLWVELEAALQHPEQLLQALAERSWLQEGQTLNGDLPSVNDLQPEPFYLLVATQQVNTSPGIQALLPELEASSLPLDANRHYFPPSLDIDGLVANHVEVQEELEARLAEQKQLQDKLKKSEQEVASYKKAVAEKDKSLQARQKEVDSIQEENDQVIAQLHQVQEELEARLTELNKLKVELKEAEQPPRQLPAVVDQEPLENAADLLGFIGKYKERKKKAKDRKRLQRHAEKIAASRWFVEGWYLDEYPDVAEDPVAAANPALHYLKYGGFENRNPGPEFNSQAYLDRYPDVAELGMNPLWHYIMHGKDEGRKLSD